MSVGTEKHEIVGTLFVLTGIVAGCAILGMMGFGLLSPLTAGLAVLAFPFFFHITTVVVLIKQGHTVAACVIGLFCGFWMLAGLSYVAMGIPGSGVTKATLDPVLLSIEPVLILASFYFQRHYLHNEKLRWTLIFLGLTVMVLFTTKLLDVSHVMWVTKKAFGKASWAGVLNSTAILALGGWICYVIVSEFENMRPIRRIDPYRGYPETLYAESHVRPVIILSMALDVSSGEWDRCRSALRSLAPSGRFTLAEQYWPHAAEDAITNGFSTKVMRKGNITVVPASPEDFANTTAVKTWLDGIDAKAAEAGGA